MGADANLIKGEYALRSAAASSGASAISAGVDTIGKSWDRLMTMQTDLDNEVQDFMDNGDLAINASGITEAHQPVISAWLVVQKNDYADLARETARLRPGTDKYIANVDKMNKISASVKRLRADATTYLEGADAYLNASKLQTFSKGNNLTDQEKNNKLYLRKGEISIGEDGQMLFKQEGGSLLTYKQASSEMFSVDEAAYSSYNKMHNDAMASKTPLTDSKYDHLLRTFTAELVKRGRNSVLSLATDYGGINVDPELLGDPDRHDELVALVAASYIGTIKDSAQEAYDLTLTEDQKEHAQALELARTKRKNSDEPTDTTRSFETMKEAFRTNDFTAYIGAKVGDKVITGVSRDSKDQNLLLVTRAGGSEPILINLTKESDRLKLRSWDANRGGYRGGQAVYKQNEPLPFKLAAGTQTSSTFESGKSTITNLGKDGGLAAKEKKAVGQLSEAFPDFKFEGVGVGFYNTILVTAPNKQTKKFPANVYGDPTDANEAMYEWMEDNQSEVTLPRTQ
jgi:hypothetical protein